MIKRYYGEMKKRNWYLTLLAGLLLLLASSIVACPSASERSILESYLDDTTAVIVEATDIALEVSNLYETAPQLDSSEVSQKSLIYAYMYDDLLSRFIALEYPEECYKLRGYVIDSLSYSRQEVTEFGAYFATGNIEHLYKAESYYSDAQRSIALAAGEMYRLERY